MKGNKTALVLMAVSMVLLTAFQVFWLRKEYLEQEANLSKESYQLFKQTITAMEDAMVREKIDKAIKADSNRKGDLTGINKFQKTGLPLTPENAGTMKKPRTFHFKDTSNHRTIVLVRNDSAGGMRSRRFKGDLGMINLPPDSIKNIVFRKKDDSSGGFNIMITMNARPAPGTDTLDQLVRMINPVRTALIEKRFKGIGRPGAPEGRMIYLNLTTDTLNTDSLKLNFMRQLMKAGKPVNVIVRRDSSGKKRETMPGGVMVSSTASPGYYYAAEFPEYRAYLFSKISSQILFSMVLLAVTGMAFGLIYQSLKQQSRLSELKNDLISNITHELKTPLSTVSVALEALQNFAGKDKPELTKEYLEISRNEVDRLSLMVDTLLKNSMLEHQSVAMQTESLDLKELTQQLIQVWKPRFEQQGADLSFSTTGEDFILGADRVHLSSVLHNLIDNALKYGGQQTRVKVSLVEKKQFIEVQVEDNGPGIPKEYRDQIFEKFFRVPTGDRHTVKGYGLGLNYVWNIVKQHGGSVRLESTSDKSSMFIVTLKKTNV